MQSMCKKCFSQSGWSHSLKNIDIEFMIRDAMKDQSSILELALVWMQNFNLIDLVQSNEHTISMAIRQYVWNLHYFSIQQLHTHTHFVFIISNNVKNSMNFINYTDSLIGFNLHQPTYVKNHQKGKRINVCLCFCYSKLPYKLSHLWIHRKSTFMNKPVIIIEYW